MFQDGSGGRPTNSPRTLSARPRLAQPVAGERSADTVAQSPPVETPPEGRKAAKVDAVVPRSQNGRHQGAITAHAEAHAYLPRGRVAVPKPVVALRPWKVHTAGPGCGGTAESQKDLGPHHPGPRAELSSTS